MDAIGKKLNQKLWEDITRCNNMEKFKTPQSKTPDHFINEFMIERNLFSFGDACEREVILVINNRKKEIMMRASEELKNIIIKYKLDLELINDDDQNTLNMAKDNFIEKFNLLKAGISNELNSLISTAF